MTRGVIPSRRAIVLLGAVCAAILVALVAGLAVRVAAWLAVAALTTLTLAAVYDYLVSRRAWRNASPRMKRLLPSAFALGVRRPITISIELDGDHAPGWAERLCGGGVRGGAPAGVRRDLPARHPLAAHRRLGRVGDRHDHDRLAAVLIETLPIHMGRCPRLTRAEGS